MNYDLAIYKTQAWVREYINNFLFWHDWKWNPAWKTYLVYICQIVFVTMAHKLGVVTKIGYLHEQNTPKRSGFQSGVVR